MDNRDQVVLKLQKEVEKRKKELGEQPKREWKTSCNFFDEGSRTNIRVVSDKTVLVDLLTHLYIVSGNYNKALKFLSEKEHPELEYKYQGYTVDEWASDFKLRFDQLVYLDKKKSLNELENKLANLESEELKTNKQLDSIQEELKNL